MWEGEGEGGEMAKSDSSVEETQGRERERKEREWRRRRRPRVVVVVVVAAVVVGKRDTRCKGVEAKKVQRRRRSMHRPGHTAVPESAFREHWPPALRLRSS